MGTPPSSAWGYQPSFYAYQIFTHRGLFLIDNLLHSSVLRPINLKRYAIPLLKVQEYIVTII